MSKTRLSPACDARRRCAALLLLLPAAGSVCAVSAAQTEQKPAGPNQKPASGNKNAKPAGTVKPAVKPASGTAPAPAAPAPAPPPAPAPAVRPPAAAGAPPGMIRLDFRGTNIDTVLQAFALAFKWTVVKDPACTGEVTVIETEPMDQQRAMEVLQALLEVRGFTAQLDGKILKVMSLKRAVASSTTVRVSDPGERATERNEIIRAVIPLSSAEAPALAKDLQPLISEGASIIGLQGSNALIITDTASNIRALRQIIVALDKGAGNSEWRIFHLKHVPAKKMVEIIDELFKQIAPRTPPMPMGQPGQPPPPPQPGQRPQERSAVAAVEDERTNSIIVVGSEANLERVAEIVKQLDEGLNPHTETKVYEVKFAEALRLAQMLNDALIGGASTQAAGQQPAPNPFGNPFGNPFERRAQGTQTASFSIGQTRVVADTRTNKLIITADADTMKKVEALLAELDQKVEYATTTFTIQLKNGNSEDMAYVLAQAFGTESPQLLNPFFGGFFGGFGGGSRESRRDRRIRRRLNGDSNDRADASLGGRLPAAASGFKPEDLAGQKFAEANGDKLPPELQRLAQFIYDPYYGSRRNQTDATTGRNSSGRYVNLLQLRGNVLVTPERNTNSLIITTSPENEAAVRELIADLDVEVKQVLLEALVVEVTLDRDRQFGVDYLFSNLRDKVEAVFPVLPGAGPLGVGLANGFRATIMRGDFRAIITAVDRDDRIRILSTPSVFTANNQEAEIEVTDSVPYLRGTTIGFGGATSSNVDFIDVGLILNVTPRITAEGMVAVDVYQEDSNLVEFRDVGNDAQAPVTTQRVTDTSVTLRDGDTLVLSGLQKRSRINSRSKIPFLGDLPLLGNLFRSNVRRDNRTELIVFLTPRVINNADEGRDLTQKELRRIQKEVPEARPRLPEPGTEPLMKPDHPDDDRQPDRERSPKG